MQNEPFDQLDPLPNPPKPKMPLGKVVLINFGIMLTYMALASGNVEEALIMDMMLIMVQVGLNMLIGFILVFTENHKQLGGAMLIGGVIMGVLGFGSCLAHITILES